jgi:hypothetical protein
MSSSEVAFSRAVIGSVVAFGVLAAAYFRLYGRRARVAVVRHLGILLPIVGMASVVAPIAFGLPLVAKILCWFLGASIFVTYLFGLIAARRLKSGLKAKSTT